MPTNKTVRVIANASNKGLKTVNIKTADATHTFPTRTQTAAPTAGVNGTVQDSGGQIAGLPTIVIPGYVGPA